MKNLKQETMITLDQVKAADKISTHNFNLMTEEAQEYIYKEIMQAYRPIIEKYDLTLSQAYDCLVALETGKHHGQSVEFPEFIAEAFHDEIGHIMPAFPFEKRSEDTQYTMSFKEWLATGVEVDDLGKVDGFQGYGDDFAGMKGWYFTDWQGCIAGVLFSPCEKVSEYWTMLGNEQPSGTLLEVSLAVYLWQLSGGCLTDEHRFER